MCNLSRVASHYCLYFGAIFALPFTAAVTVEAAQEAPADQISLERAARDAIAWHPSLAQAAGTLSARGEDVNVARAAYRPQISAGVGVGHDSRITDGWRPRPQVSAQQNLYDFGKTDHDVDAARAATRASRADLLQAVDSLLRETAYAYIEVQRANALRLVAQDQLARIGDIHRMVQARYELGAATRSDALQSQARLESASAMITQIDAALARWISNLTHLTGHPLSATQIPPSPAEWLDQACVRGWSASAETASVMAAEARREQAAAEFRRSQADRLPTIALAGDASSDVIRPFGDQANYNFGLRISTSLFNGGAAKARAKGAGYAVDAAKASVDWARTEMRQRLSEAREQISGLRELLDTLASREANMAETGKLYRLQYFDMGTRTLVDLLNAEQELQQVRMDRTNSIHDLRRMQLECSYFSGAARKDFGLEGHRVRGVVL